MDVRINNQLRSDLINNAFDIYSGINGKGSTLRITGTNIDSLSMNDSIDVIDGSTVLFSGNITAINRGVNSRDDSMSVDALDHTFQLKWLTLDEYEFSESKTMLEIVQEVIDLTKEQYTGSPFVVTPDSVPETLAITRGRFERTNAHEIIFHLARDTNNFWYVQSVLNPTTNKLEPTIFFRRGQESDIPMTLPVVEDITNVKRDSIVDRSRGDVPYRRVVVSGGRTVVESSTSGLRIVAPELPSTISFPRTADTDATIGKIKVDNLIESSTITTNELARLRNRVDTPPTPPIPPAADTFGDLSPFFENNQVLARVYRIEDREDDTRDSPVIESLRSRLALLESGAALTDDERLLLTGREENTAEATGRLATLVGAQLSRWYKVDPIVYPSSTVSFTMQQNVTPPQWFTDDLIATTPNGAYYDRAVSESNKVKIADYHYSGWFADDLPSANDIPDTPTEGDNVLRFETAGMNWQSDDGSFVPHRGLFEVKIYAIFTVDNLTLPDGQVLTLPGGVAGNFGEDGNFDHPINEGSNTDDRIYILARYQSRSIAEDGTLGTPDAESSDLFSNLPAQHTLLNFMKSRFNTHLSGDREVEMSIKRGGNTFYTTHGVNYTNPDAGNAVTAGVIDVFDSGSDAKARFGSAMYVESSFLPMVRESEIGERESLSRDKRSLFKPFRDGDVVSFTTSVEGFQRVGVMPTDMPGNYQGTDLPDVDVVNLTVGNEDGLTTEKSGGSLEVREFPPQIVFDRDDQSVSFTDRIDDVHVPALQSDPPIYRGEYTHLTLEFYVQGLTSEGDRYYGEAVAPPRPAFADTFQIQNDGDETATGVSDQLQLTIQGGNPQTITHADGRTSVTSITTDQFRYIILPDKRSVRSFTITTNGTQEFADYFQQPQEEVTSDYSRFVRSVVVFMKLRDDVPSTDVFNVSSSSFASEPVFTEQHVVSDLSYSLELTEGTAFRDRISFPPVDLSPGTWLMGLSKQAASTVPSGATDADISEQYSWAVVQTIFHGSLVRHLTRLVSLSDMDTERARDDIISPSVSMHFFDHNQVPTERSISRDIMLTSSPRTFNEPLFDTSGMQFGDMPNHRTGSSPGSDYIFNTRIEWSDYFASDLVGKPNPTYYATVPSIRDNEVANEFAKRRLDFFLEKNQRSIDFTTVNGTAADYDVGTVSRLRSGDEPIIITGKRYQYNKGYAETTYSSENNYPLSDEDILIDIIDRSDDL